VEIIGELLLALLELIAEFVLQVVFEALAELGLRSIREPCRQPKPLNPFIAAVGYAIFGTVADVLSLWLLPTLFIRVRWLRVVNLLLTPIAAGGVMAALGAWRCQRDEDLIRIDRFSYGLLFAFAMALVRFIWGH
jgi:hypothetical protein